MRLDLHNHTTPAGGSVFARRSTVPQKAREFYLKELHSHCLDGVAITNSHDIEVAMALAKESPGHILVGAEYQVVLGEGASAQVVVVGVDHSLHQRLMDARLRGIAHFTAIAKQNCLLYFLAHIGWGIDADHPRAPELLEKILAHSIAIEVLNAYDAEDCGFAFALARYYGLSPVGGSSHLWCRTGKRAYTEASDARSIEEFFKAFYQRKVDAKVTGGAWRKNYLPHIQKFWHSEVGWHREAIKRMGETILMSVLEDLPDYYHLQQSNLYRRKALRLQQRFVAYLKLKETRRILSLDLPIERQKELWGAAMAEIYRCFPE